MLDVKISFILQLEVEPYVKTAITGIVREKMKTRIKGSKARLELIKYLESIGFEVAIVERTGRFIFPKDEYGLFDIEAIKPNITLKIQITCNKPHTHQGYVEFSGKYPQFKVIQAVRIDRVGWKVYTYPDKSISQLSETFK